MNLAGQVIITLPDRVQVKRPMPADKLFADKPAAQVRQMLPLLYSLCAQAQSAAAQMALTDQPPEQATLRQVAIEAMREHILFLQTLFPALQSFIRGIAHWHKQDETTQQAQTQRVIEVLQLEAGDLLQILQTAKNALQKNGQKWPKSAVNGLNSHFATDFSAETFENMRRSSAWCAQPVLNGRAQENSYYTRGLRVHGFVADAAGRVAARLWDVYQWFLVVMGRQPQFPLWGMAQQDGWGFGWIETARGRLYHATLLEGEQIKTYRICAPTEWNFHPEGVLAQWLAIERADDMVLAQNMAQLIDPCVAVEIEHA